jgi:hypothetical protein
VNAKGRILPVLTGQASTRIGRQYPEGKNSRFARWDCDVMFSDAEPELTVQAAGSDGERVVLALVSRGPAASNYEKDAVQISETYQYYAANEWIRRRDSEITFWKRWVASKGLQWQKDFSKRVSPDLELPPFIEKQLLQAGVDSNTPLRILDVGSGPLTFVGTQSRTFKEVEVVPIDPLADFYNGILAENHISPPNPTTKGSVENLLGLFPPKSFHCIWICNALDHSYDPLMGLITILTLITDRGIALVGFHPREATHGKYQGLHQWDFCISDKGDFLIERLGLSLNITKLFANHCRITVTAPSGTNKNNPKSRIFVRFQKVRDLNVTEVLGLVA